MFIVVEVVCYYEVIVDEFGDDFRVVDVGEVDVFGLGS